MPAEPAGAGESIDPGPAFTTGDAAGSMWQACGQALSPAAGLMAGGQTCNSGPPVGKATGA